MLGGAMSKTVYLLLALILSCSHQPKRKLSEIRGSYSENIQHLNLWNSFAFIHEGHEYYFARKLEAKKENIRCEYFVGFVDGQHKYTFPTSRFKELNDVYESKLSLEERMSIVVKKLDEFQKDDLERNCHKEDSSTTAADILNFIVYSPAIILTAPIWGSQLVVDAYHNYSIKMDELRLKMSFKEVKELLNQRPFYIREENNKTYYIVDKRYNRLVMYFENEKLRAWVRGWKPSN